ncbi:hypothetical protein HYX17_02735 [Candidatus Woesearchaeota archaeon]|nr:hypothetical protein [Candidatus Woesearchaeota archaeon]
MVNISETEDISKLLDETFPEAIKRIPIHPNSAEITFLAHGISIPDPKEKDHSDYLRKCIENGIHPYSSGEFEYSRDTEKFVPTLMQTAIPFRSSKITLNEVINPGKINKLKFSIGKYYGANEFGIFLTCLDELLKRDYKMAGGNLRFNGDDGKLIYPCAEISFDIHLPPKYFRLDIKDERYRDRFDKLFSIVMTNGQQLKLF